MSQMSPNKCVFSNRLNSLRLSHCCILEGNEFHRRGTVGTQFHRRGTQFHRRGTQFHSYGTQ